MHTKENSNAQSINVWNEKLRQENKECVENMEQIVVSY